MYKIFLLVRDSISQPLYTPYKIKSEKSNLMVDFETEDEKELERAINELGQVSPRKQILPVTIIPFINETIIGDE